MISLLGSLLGFGTSFLPSVLGFFEKKQQFKQDLSKINNWTKEELENFLKNFLKEKNIKYPIFAKPLRFILTKFYDGPSLSDIFFILGKKGSMERLNQYITKT